MGFNLTTRNSNFIVNNYLCTQRQPNSFHLKMEFFLSFRDGQ